MKDPMQPEKLARLGDRVGRDCSGQPQLGCAGSG